tara:strand:- start:293 stop:2746 length:2454 start_codon:yes stop_codon:yes gene_type:complete
MRKIIKKLSIVITLAISAFVIISLITAFLFSEKIEKSVIKNITSNINSEIEMEDVSFQLFEDFPYSVVKISNLYIQESSNFGNDTLIFSKQAYIKFNLFEMLSENIFVNNITLTNGLVSVQYDGDDNNYNIFNNSNKGNLKLNNIKLFDTELRYRKVKNKTKIIIDCKDISIKKSDINKLEVYGNAYSKKLEVYSNDYINNKKLKLKLKIQNKEKELVLEKSSIQINDLNFSLSGSLQNNYLKLFLIAKNHSISSFIKNTPTHLNKIYSSFLADGVINYSAEIKGEISKLKNLNLDLKYSLNNGVFEMKKYPFSLSKISCSGIINNGIESNFKTTQISFEKFIANTKKGNIDGGFVVNNLNNYFLKANFKSNWALQEANYYFSESPLYEASGTINAQTVYKGNISFNESFNTLFTEAEHSSFVNLSDVKFTYRNFHVPIQIFSSDLNIDNNKIKVLNSSIYIKDSDLNFEGNITNVLRYILLDDYSQFDIDGNLSSKTLNLKSLLYSNDKDQKINARFKMPEYFTLKLNTDILSLTYNNVYPNNIKGKLIYNNNSLTTKDLKLNIFSGKIILNGKFYQKDFNQFKATSSIKLEKVNINKVFSAFNNFGQDFIQHKHIKGICTSNLIVNALWDSSLNFQPNNLDISAKISIEEGELINFKPLESVSNFVKMKDLSHIKFSKLENEIKIKDEVISIPSMEIKSNALSLLISGKHQFNQKYNYKINLLLSELLTKRFRNKTPNFNQKDTLIPLKTNLQLKMIGDKDDIKISFEKLKIKENIKDGIRKEIININKIISEEIKNKDDIEETDDIEIEWDDNL